MPVLMSIITSPGQIPAVPDAPAPISMFMTGVPLPTRRLIIITTIAMTLTSLTAATWQKGVISTRILPSTPITFSWPVHPVSMSEITPPPEFRMMIIPGAIEKFMAANTVPRHPR